MAADGPRALAVTAPLAAAVWGYDLALKATPVASTSMSACRGLDVLMGSGAHGAASRAARRRGRRRAHRPSSPRSRAARSRAGTPSVPKRALAATVGVAAAGALLSRRAPKLGRVAALGLVGAYAAVVGRAHADAVADPSPARMQRAVGAGILGLIPLEAGLLAGAGALAPAAGVAALWPLARRAAKKRAVT